MNKQLIKGLFGSFQSLEQAIQTAKAIILERDGGESDLLSRLESYEEALEKQRNLALTLCGHAALGDWNEVSRHIRLISNLSQMIRDDAREILQARRNNQLEPSNPTIDKPLLQ